jgi:hypothetical protein
MPDMTGRQRSPIEVTSPGESTARDQGQESTRTRKRPVRPWALAALGVLAAAGIGWAIVAAGNEPDVAAPLDTAESLMNALNAHDVDAMLAFTEEEVLAGDAEACCDLGSQVDDGTIEWFRSEVEQEGVLGWTYHFTCEIADAGAEATVVRCPYSFTNHITEVFGLGPYEGSDVTLRIADGEVISYTNHEFSDEWQAEDGGLYMFFGWMIENHPEDFDGAYYNYGGEANLNFWKKYIPLFLAREEAAG